MFNQAIKSLLNLVWPIALANIIAMISLLINLKLISEASSKNLYIITLFLPLNFWIIALFESLRIPATNISAYAFYNNKTYLIGPQLFSLLLVNLFGIMIPLCCCLFFKTVMSNLLGISIHDFYSYNKFFVYMLLSSIFWSTFYIFSGVLNGVGKQMLSTFLVLSGMLMTTTLNTYLIKETTFDIFSLPLSMFITYAVLLLITILILIKNNLLLKDNLITIFNSRHFIYIKRLAFPIWCTYMILSLTLWLFNRILSQYGHAVLSGFGIAYRIQTLCLIPAIAFGTAIGILYNKNGLSLQGERSSYNEILIQGLHSCLIVYSIMAVVLYYFSQDVILFITSDNIFMSNAKEFLRIVSPTYLSLAIFICYTTTLDQIGYGFESCFFTLLLLTLEIFIVLVIFNNWKTPTALYYSIAIGNLISGFISLVLITFKIPNFKHILKSIQ